MRTCLGSTVLLLLVACGTAGDGASPDAPRVIEDASVGSTAPDGIDLGGRQALVVALTSADCPISKLYAPKLKRMEGDLAAKGVGLRVIACNTGRREPLVEALGARRTTEVFLFDAKRVLRYRGAIDDQYGLSYHRDEPRRTYLLDAVDAVLAGREVAVKATEAPGCAVEKPAASTASVTFHKDVEPILQRRCQECHRPGEIGPFSLLSYESAKKNARMIKEVVEARRMPPWHADPKHGAWANDRRLSDGEVSTISKWVDGGTPAGEAADAPPARVWPKGWRIGTPDKVYEAPEYRVRAEGTIPYQYFEVKTDLKEDVWVQAMEVRPGARAAVHHILVFVEFPRGRLREQPPIDGGLFYGYFAVMVPGEQPMVFPEGMGKKIPAGATLHFQVHYTATGEEHVDKSAIGLVFAKKPVAQEVITRGIINQKIKIPAGAENHQETATFTFPHDAKILSFMPHMHLRGKAFKYVAIHPDKTEEVLLDVPAYDFRWQTTYVLKEPKAVKKGTKIRVTAAWDNSAKNPANPDPTAVVRFGDQTWEEMLNGYVDFVKAK